MMNQSQYYLEKIETVPEDLQYAISVSDWEKSLAELQKQYKLHLDQGQVLEQTAIKLMFGDIDATDFINILFKEGHISSQVAADMLLDIDQKILKKIRETVEVYAQAEKTSKEIRSLGITEEEKDEEEKSEIYAQYYANVAKILKETEDQMIAEGINPDVSNITDEMTAKNMGLTLEEYNKLGEEGGLAQANKGLLDDSTIDITKEKEDLMKELEEPHKSFIKPLFTQVEQKPITPDHQLENTHIELPYHEPESTIVVSEETSAHNTTPEPTMKEVVTAPVVEPIKHISPEVKIPTKINLTNDAYREPIE